MSIKHDEIVIYIVLGSCVTAVILWCIFAAWVTGLF